jgi:hypothetical protein
LSENFDASEIGDLKKRRRTLHFFQTAQIPAKKLRSFDSYTPKKALYGIFRAAFNSSLDAPQQSPAGIRLLPGPGTLTHNDAHKTVQRIRKRKRSR